MKQKTGIEVTMQVAIAKVLSRYTLWLERFNVVNLFPLIPAIPTFLVVTLLIIPGTLIDRIKNFVWLVKWMFAGIFSGIGFSDKSFDCIASFTQVGNKIIPHMTNCTGSQYVVDGLSAGIQREITAATIGLLIAGCVWVYSQKKLARENKEAKEQMEHFNYISGSIMSTPAEIMERVEKANRGEEWELK